MNGLEVNFASLKPFKCAFVSSLNEKWRHFETVFFLSIFRLNTAKREAGPS